MKKHFKILILISIIFGVQACDDYGQFKVEMYERNIYIVSDGNFNIFKIECDLDAESAAYNVSLSAAGTTAIDKDVVITLKRDEESLKKYNTANFDLETQFAKEFTEDKYKISSYEVALKANSKYVYALLPIQIEQENLYSLSPDSLYFIPLIIDNVSAYQTNKKKENALIQILPKNHYARMKTKTTYYLSGNIVEEGSLPHNANIDKTVLPLTKNSVRMHVGIQNIKDAKIEELLIKTIAMTVTVNENRSLSIAPTFPDANLLEVEMLSSLEPDFLYNNRYEEYLDAYVPDKLHQRFLMYYKYRNRTSVTGNWSKWFYISEATSRLAD